MVRTKKLRQKNKRTRREGFPRKDKLNFFASHASDTLVKEFIEKGMFCKIDRAPLYSQEMSLLDQVRQAISSARIVAVMGAEGKLIREPRYISTTKRFFEDLKRILFLIDRNKNLEEHGIWFVTEPRRRSAGYSSDALTLLKAHLEKVAEEIRTYLNTVQIRPVEALRNADPLSDKVIMELFEVWSELRRYKDRYALRQEDRRPFAQLAAATWREAGFPLKDHRGRSREPLEQWIADRIRKHWCTRNLPDDEIEANSIDI